MDKSFVRDTIERGRETIGNSVQGAKDRIGSIGIVDNPLAMLFAGLAIGFLFGMLLPVTRLESERIAPIAEDLRERVKGAGAEVARRGSEVLRDTIAGGKEAATESLREQAAELTAQTRTHYPPP